MLTQTELQSKLHYNQNTGIFTWLKNNKQAGYKNKKGYIIININKKMYAAHRLAWIYMYKTILGCIDHINTIKDDNRIVNLRIATLSQNGFNRQLNKNNKSGVKGVYWHSRNKKWIAQLKVNNTKIIFGSFSDIELAKIAINEARIKYHGEFANNG
jgi:hypothetical protein